MRVKDLIFSFFYYRMEAMRYARMRRELDAMRAGAIHPFGLNIAGYLTVESGLGESARSLVRMADAAGVPVALNEVPQKWLRSKDLRLADRITQTNPYAINLLHVNADMTPYAANRFGKGWLGGRRNIGYWYWELDEFPTKWVNSSSCLDEIWVASDFCRDAIAAKVDVPVVKVRPSVTVELPREYVRSEFGIPEGAFVFLSVFDFSSSFERKNPLAAIRAFKSAFKGKGDVALVLKTTNSKGHEQRLSEVRALCEGLPVIVIDRYLDRHALAGLISVSDCYVSLHRSEGFGFPIAEAMALGKPAIATAYSGSTEFMDGDNSMPVPYALRTIERTEGAYLRGARWAEPDEATASAMMRALYDDRSRALDMGRRAMKYMQDNWSPAARSADLKRALDSLHSRRD